MTDELTPEEREALANLPRERTPSAGLEDRVVAAMRERGHLARKPARVIRITNTRVAGLLAACLVLMIGAYSIGLHRRVDNSVPTNIEPRDSNFSELSTGRTGEEIGLKPPAPKEQPVRTDAAASNEVDKGLIEGKAPPFGPKLTMPELATPKDAKKERATKQDEVTESMAKSFSDRIASGASAPAPASETPAQLKAEPSVAAGSVAQRQRTFALNGGTLIVDAPDSVRVVQDEQGRTLIIYTSDGVIRIRLAD